MADGPEAGLALVDALGGELDGYHLFHAARADLLRRLDRRAEAADAYRRALELRGQPGRARVPAGADHRAGSSTRQAIGTSGTLAMLATRSRSSNSTSGSRWFR